MEINKQLFEDVLSRKLKGTFVLRCGEKCFSSELGRNYNHFSFTHPYMIGIGSYTAEGKFREDGAKCNFDIVDFISDTNMKENELTIEIPDGKIVNWDESKKQNKLVLKDKQLTYKDICGALYKDKIVYYTDMNGGIDNMPFSELTEDTPYDSNNATIEHQLECILAKNQLANVAMFLNNGWAPNYDKEDYGWFIYYHEYSNKLYFSVSDKFEYNNNVLFKSKELAQQAIEILGKEIVMRAVEPLGFVKTK